MDHDRMFIPVSADNTISAIVRGNGHKTRWRKRYMTLEKLLNYAQLLSAIDDFKESAYKLSEAWSQVETDAGISDYPFERDFDDEVCHIANWCNSFEEELQSEFEGRR
jgi:hypothetical protein